MRLRPAVVVTVVASISLSFVGWIRTNGPAIGSNHTFSSSSNESSGDLSSGIMDLPGAGEGQDALPELSGSITNGLETQKIWNLRFWFEDDAGNELTATGSGRGGASGRGPVSGLKTGNAQSPGGLASAELVSTIGGVSTFDLNSPIAAGDTADYEAQVDAFSEPNNFKVKVAYSSSKVGKNYEGAGEHAYDEVDARRLFEASAPTTRTGIVLGAINHGSSVLTGLTIELITRDPHVELVGGEARNHQDEVCPGAILTITSPTSATVTGLNVSNPNWVTLWLDLSQPYASTVVVRVAAEY